MRKCTVWLLASLFLLGLESLWAQPGARFDAVSSKLNRSGLPNSDTTTTLGRLSLTNVTPLSLLFRAFGVLGPQIIGAPGWASTERYDVVAVTGGADRLTDKERQSFIQSMLEERWNLRFHRETRQLSVFALQIDKDAKLRVHAGAGEYAMKVTNDNGRRILNSTKGNIPRLVEILSGATGKLVVNETGLTGEYDFTLEWVQDLDSEAAGPSLTTALREQLGLRLDSVKRPVEVVVIDGIDRPSEN